MSGKSSATYYNTLTPIAKTRIMADRNMVTSDAVGYNSSDIYFNFDDTKINNEFKIMMIGSKEIDNPYFGGYFMFNGKFPDQYPFFPPHVLAKTQGENTRFHPNYYVNGKCCLSILGTWSGPPWTSCQNLGTVAQSLKMLYIKNPITQEPSWEKCRDERAMRYARVVEYRTLQVAIINMLTSPPNGFKPFLPIMEKTFLEMYDDLMKKIEANASKYDGKEESSPIYGMKVKYDYKKLKNKYKLMYKQLREKYPEEIKEKVSEIPKPTQEDSQSINSDEVIDIDKKKVIKIIKIKKKKGKRVPNAPAKNFEVGHQEVSENSGFTYIVGVDVNGHKRWKKI